VTTSLSPTHRKYQLKPNIYILKFTNNILPEIVRLPYTVSDNACETVRTATVAVL